MIEPNRLYYAKCPHCKVTLNSWSWVPLDALASQYFRETRCPMKDCGKPIDVRVHVTFKVEAEKGE
jgi:hypothetical protein